MRCPKCGGSIHKEDIYCDNCGCLVESHAIRKIKKNSMYGKFGRKNEK